MSIYDSEYVSGGDYFDTLRGNVKRDYDKRTKRATEDYGFSKEKLDNGIGDLREDTKTNKERTKENFDFSKEQFNEQLARITQKTFRRYVKNSPNMPTQIGLQNLATRASAIDKERKDFLNKRGFDRTIFDLDKQLNRGERDYDLGSRINYNNMERRKEDASDWRDDTLLDFNNRESRTLDGLEYQNSMSSASLGNSFNYDSNIRNGYNSPMDSLSLSSENPNPRYKGKSFTNAFNRWY